MALTESQIRKLAAKDRRYKRADSGGLAIEVMPTGDKYWRVGYRIDGHRRTRTLGSYPIIKLSEARGMRDQIKADLFKKFDPDTGSPISESNFTHKESAAKWRDLCNEFIEKLRLEERSELTLRKLSRNLERTCSVFGDSMVDDIEPCELLAICRQAEEREQYETAKEIRSASSRVARYAIACGQAKHDFAAGLRGALVGHKTKSLAAITEPRQVGQLMRAMNGFEGQFLTKTGLLVTAHTWLRSSELRFATWDQIDWDQALWTVPAERMKMKRKHMVPLSSQSMDLLRQLYSYNGHNGDKMFPSSHKTGKFMSENTLGNALKSMGYDGSRHVPHGFRTMASTNLNEMGWNRDWIEKQLAHEDSSVRGVYNAAEYLEGRREMMQAYSDWLDVRAADISTATRPGQ